LCADNVGNTRTDCTINAGAATAAGATGNIQFNTGNSLDAVAGFTWDKTNSRLGIGSTTPFATLSASSTSANPTAIFDQRGSGNILNLQRAGVDQITVSNNGTLNVVGTSTLPIIAPVTDSTTAIRIRDAAGTDTVITFDTTNNRVQIGTGAGSASPALLVLDTKSTVGDPTGVNGAMYYNSNTLRFRCFDNSAWTDCGSRTDAINFLATSTPTTPDAGELRMFGRSVGGRMMPAVIGPSGLDTALQPFIGRNKVAIWSHGGNSAAITAPTLFLLNFVHVAANDEGTATVRNVTASTNILNGVRRLGYVTTGAVNLSVEIRQILQQWFRGDATTKGGFFMTARFGYNTAASGNRGFVGFSSNTAIFTITADPSVTGTGSCAICIGFGFDATDTNWQVFARTATGDTLTKTDTGIAKPVANKLYDIAIFSPPEGTSVSLSITDVNTGTIYSLTTSTALPPVNQLMVHRIYGNTGTSGSILGLDVSTMYLETDY